MNYIQHYIKLIIKAQQRKGKKGVSEESRKKMSDSAKIRHARIKNETLEEQVDAIIK